MSMYMYLLVSWFLGSFLFSCSLDNEKTLDKQMGNVRIFPILLFMVYMLTAMLVVFTGTTNVDWKDPGLMFSVETFPFAIISTYALLIADLMFSKVTLPILKDVSTGFADLVRSIFVRMYCEVDPKILRRRKEELLKREKSMGY